MHYGELVNDYGLICLMYAYSYTHADGGQDTHVEVLFPDDSAIETATAFAVLVRRDADGGLTWMLERPLNTSARPLHEVDPTTAMDHPKYRTFLTVCWELEHRWPDALPT